MIDTDTFLTTLYLMADDFCKYQLPPVRRPGPKASLAQSEVVVLTAFSQWSRFSSQRDFYRYATRNLRSAFPTLPYRGQFNRMVRCHYDTIVAFFLYLVELAGSQAWLLRSLGQFWGAYQERQTPRHWLASGSS